MRLPPPRVTPHRTRIGIPTRPLHRDRPSFRLKLAAQPDQRLEQVPSRRCIQFRAQEQLYPIACPRPVVPVEPTPEQDTLLHVAPDHQNLSIFPEPRVLVAHHAIQPVPTNAYQPPGTAIGSSERPAPLAARISS